MTTNDMTKKDNSGPGGLLFQAVSDALTSELEAVLKVEGQPLPDRRGFCLRINFAMQSNRKSKDNSGDDIQPVID